MIARSHFPREAPWRRSLAAAITDPAELLTRLGLPASLLPAAERAAAVFPLRVPESFLARMRPGDPADPLLAQVLPLGAELEAVPGFGRDPVAELGKLPAQGIVHKYHGRLLLMPTGACAVHCRYCFRRHFPYEDHQTGVRGWDEALAHIRSDTTVSEVILSGGDPLLLLDEHLARLAEELAAIPHVERLRVHTRTPVVLPDRVDEALLAWLTGTGLRPVMVLHVNHARELAGELPAALARLRGAGVPLLAQSVLLQGVNDSVAALADLSRALFSAGVLPYYLNLLDRVEGAAHFDVPEEEARALHRALTLLLPGYLVPRLVRDVPGEGAKVGV